MIFPDMCDQLAQGYLIIRNNDYGHQYLTKSALIEARRSTVFEPSFSDIQLAQSPSKIPDDRSTAHSKSIVLALHLPGDGPYQLVSPVGPKRWMRDDIGSSQA
jgi:hypothetical protein